MKPYKERKEILLKASREKILVIDGAMGTAIQNYNLTEADFGGAEYDGCNENLILTRPKIIQEIHASYLQAGCDIIESNTFGSTPLVLDEYGLGAKAFEISRLGALLAHQVADQFSTPDKPRFVAGSMGPTTKALSVTGGIEFNELVEHFFIQAEGLMAGGSDYLLLETAQDSRNLKAGLLAIEQLENKLGEKILTAISGTIETMGTMLGGQTVEAFAVSMMHKDLFYIGLNCATGPEFMTDHIRSLAQYSSFPIACVPNAGLPDEDGIYLETPETMSKTLRFFLEEGWVQLVGGCCGTRHQHIHSFSSLVEGYKPKRKDLNQKSYLAGLDYLEVSSETRPLIVGERTNVIGSKKFKTLITEEKFEEAAEIARAQVKSGAHIIDICLSNPDRNEIEDTRRFMEKVIKVIKAPLMIDSTDEKVIQLALTYCQGKSIINSINLEDGEERFEKVVPLAKSYGAALVVGTIDEDPEHGMAVTRERKLEIALRSFELLTNKYKIPAEDIYFDALVFPCATGDKKYVGSAKETIEGIRLIKKALPQCKTVLGVSNVSFGLPAAGREVLNSVFLYHCVEAGLDLAIVNSEKLERYASLQPAEVELSNNLLFNLGDDPIAKFAAQFRERKIKNTDDRLKWPLDVRLAKNIVDGTKEGLVEDLDLAMKTSPPLEIINGPLMRGMDEVGKLFNANKLIVAEVLQSAEVMKAAVSHLEKFMAKADQTNRGVIVLATVKGDVHDIGKNLVDIILSNNGYKVINLGIKVPSEKLIEEIKKSQPDMIGLSGLLVKSAQQMVIAAEDFSRAGIQIPMLVGGAALSRNFTEKRILPAYLGPVFYAQDAMNGLDLANQIQDPPRYQLLLKDILAKRESHAMALQTAKPKIPMVEIAESRSNIKSVDIFPQPPDFDRHVIRQASVDVIWKYINPLMLYNRHLGVKGKSAKLIAQIDKNKEAGPQLKSEDPQAFELWQKVEQIKQEYKNSDIFRPTAVYQFFRAQGGNALNPNQLDLFSSTKAIAQFSFPRQKQAPFLCLADYTSSSFNGDSVALFVTTAGNKVRQVASDFKDQGEYLKSHILQALAIETAEAYAEYLHGFLRGLWGFPDSPQTTMMDRFQAKYQGKRYSFGYPACPRLEDQKILFELLKPEDIGVELTEGFMMDPEASVSALVFHHPEASYYSVGNPFDENLTL